MNVLKPPFYLGIEDDDLDDGKLPGPAGPPSPRDTDQDRLPGEIFCTKKAEKYAFLAVNAKIIVKLRSKQ